MSAGQARVEAKLDVKLKCGIIRLGGTESIYTETKREILSIADNSRIICKLYRQALNRSTDDAIDMYDSYKLLKKALGLVETNEYISNLCNRV